MNITKFSFIFLYVTLCIICIAALTIYMCYEHSAGWAMLAVGTWCAMIVLILYQQKHYTKNK